MPKFQICIEYVGDKFKGWQVQKKEQTAQGTIQKELSKILKEKITLTGAGRLDKGVHAYSASAHFDCKKKINDHKKFLKSANYFLNKKLISILSIRKRNQKFHARYSAKMRTYLYVIYNRESPPSINKRRGWHIKRKLNLKLMKSAAKMLTGHNDYNTFRASSCSAKSPVRTINNFTITKSNETIKIRIKSKSFLQQQIRGMVGSIKCLGEGKWDLKYFEKVFKLKKRSLCGPPAPPYGLFLEKIIY